MSLSASGQLPSTLRILVRGVNWLGDAVMTTPALLRLREKFPDAHITLLGPEKLKDLWLNHPAINETISFTAEESIWSVSKKLRLNLGPEVLHGSQSQSFHAASSLREPMMFDLALVLPNSPRSAIETWLARIPQRIGYARPLRNWFLTKAVPTYPGHVQMHKRSVKEIQDLTSGSNVTTRNTEHEARNTSSHQIYEYLHLVGALGAKTEPLAPQLFVNESEIESARQKFGLTEISQPIFGLNPGAEYGPAKRWPVERFIAAAIEIQKRTNCAWLIFGGKGDMELARRIESSIHDSRFTTHNLSGQTSLRELMSLLKLCRVLLTNDTGPMHVAAALGTPVAVPFGSTSPDLTGPGLPGDARQQFIKSDAPCSPCFLRECPIDFRCMNGISVERVVEAVLKTV
jgi:heptosyltransferase-2